MPYITQYFVSPAAESVLAYADIVAEWYPFTLLLLVFFLPLSPPFIFLVIFCFVFGGVTDQVILFIYLGCVNPNKTAFTSQILHSSTLISTLIFSFLSFLPSPPLSFLFFDTCAQMMRIGRLIHMPHIYSTLNPSNATPGVKRGSVKFNSIFYIQFYIFVILDLF